ncbi:MAG: hypothetical protein JO102_07855, partial [Elusimicrobia bacterium]|nr:hypothetical protein [Elusimicrobiota bacterium]
APPTLFQHLGETVFFPLIRFVVLGAVFPVLYAAYLPFHLLWFSVQPFARVYDYFSTRNEESLIAVAAVTARGSAAASFAIGGALAGLFGLAVLLGTASLAGGIALLAVAGPFLAIPFVLFASQAIRIAFSAAQARRGPRTDSDGRPAVLPAYFSAIDIRRLPGMSDSELAALGFVAADIARVRAFQGRIAFVAGGRLFADLARLSYLPETLQRSILEHEYAHQDGLGETGAFLSQIAGFPSTILRALKGGGPAAVSRRERYDEIDGAFRRSGFSAAALAATLATFDGTPGHRMSRPFTGRPVRAALFAGDLFTPTQSSLLHGLLSRISPLVPGETVAFPESTYHLTFYAPTRPEAGRTALPDGFNETLQFATTEAMIRAGGLRLERPRLIVAADGAVIVGWEVVGGDVDAARALARARVRTLMPDADESPRIVVHTTLGRVLSLDHPLTDEERALISAEVDQINRELSSDDIQVPVRHVDTSDIVNWHGLHRALIGRFDFQTLENVRAALALPDAAARRDAIAGAVTAGDRQNAELILQLLSMAATFDTPSLRPLSADERGNVLAAATAAALQRDDHDELVQFIVELVRYGERNPGALTRGAAQIFSGAFEGPSLEPHWRNVLAALDSRAPLAERRRAIVEIIDGSPIRLGLEELRARGDGTGRLEGDLSEGLSVHLEQARAAGAPAYQVQAARRRASEGVWSLLNGGRRESGMFAGSIGALAAEAPSTPRPVVTYRFLADTDPDLALQRAAYHARRLREAPSTETNVLGVVTDQPAVAEALRAGLAADIAAGRVRVLLRDADTTLTGLHAALSSDARMRELVGRAEFRLLLPKGVELPASFFDVDPSQAWRYRVFALITDALNAVAVEVRGNGLDGIMEKLKVVASQA